MLTEQLKKYYRTFVINALIVTASISLLYVLALLYLPAIYISPAIPWIIIFFLIITLSIFYFQLMASIKRVSKFVNVFMVAIGLKLIAFLIIIALYAFLNKADAINFIISFFIIYLIFTVFEILQLLKVQNSLKPGN
ncbi:MAG: hypothetical protein B6D64_06145 [Bacteroidetes bacterium 4484_276]|nr:MAG: hypothetical protein B6D64_06145 [Bacteroidetes bacterium 4484_276]OYT14322.1 MAG: hypothetical protein B6I19_00515 [Bacteroidetes bacterium 4572_114]